MNNPRMRKDSPLYTIGQAIEAQFDRMDRDLSRIRPRQINEYNQIVYMTRLIKEGK